MTALLKSSTPLHHCDIDTHDTVSLLARRNNVVSKEKGRTRQSCGASIQYGFDSKVPILYCASDWSEHKTNPIIYPSVHLLIQHILYSTEQRGGQYVRKGLPLHNRWIGDILVAVPDLSSRHTAVIGPCSISCIL